MIKLRKMSLNAPTLKNKIETGLSDVIGTYTYSNGYSRSAIAVGNPPNELKVEGLEVILPLMPEGTGVWLSDSILSKDNWTIYLIQREGCTAQDFVTACTRMKRFFYNANFNFIPQSETIGTYNQFVISYSHTDLETTYTY